jgi:hypothetical protein
LLAQANSPVILCELEDIRSRTWGHTAKQTADFVRSFGYRWFRPLSGGTLTAIPEDPELYEGNFIGVPPGRVNQLEGLIKNESCG